MTNTPRVEIRSALTLDTGPSKELKADLYLPPECGAERRPAVVLVFGGGWREGDRSQQRFYGLALAQAGFVCLATDYRPSTLAHWPAQLEDVRTAIAWLRGQADKFQIDPGRIAVSGNSSGGHLALMVAAAQSESPKDGETETNASSVGAVCAFYPPTRLEGLDAESNDDTVRSLLGFGASREAYRRASPLAYAVNRWPPVLLLAGAEDARVPVRHTLDFHQALVAAGNTVELHVFAGLGHAFDMQRDRAELAAGIVIRFLRECL